MRTLLLGCALVVSAQAQSIDIFVPDADPGTGLCTSQAFGVTSSFGSMIVPAARLGSQPGVIEELAFAPCASGTFVTGSFQLVIGHLSTGWLHYGVVTAGVATSYGSLDDVTVAWDSAIHGPFSWSYTQDTWSPLGFGTQPIGTGFVWDGVRDVAIQLHHGSSYGGSGVHVEVGGTLFAPGLPTFYAGPKTRITLRPVPAVPTIQRFGFSSCNIQWNLELLWTNQPLIGQPRLTFTLTPAIPWASTLLYASAGSGSPSAIGWMGCQTWLDVASASAFIANGFGPFSPVPSGAPSPTWIFAIPNDPSLAGLGLAVQAGVSSGLHLYTTNAIEFTIQ